MALAPYYVPLESGVIDMPWSVSKDIVLSIEEFLRKQRYERESETGTIFQRYEDDARKSTTLEWRTELPDDMTELPLPCLVLDATPDIGESDHMMSAGSEYIGEPRYMVVSGYCGGETASSTFKNNNLQLASLMEDLRNLLDHGENGTGMISLYHFDSDGNIDATYAASSIRLMDVVAMKLGSVGATDNERYRFEITFTALVLTSRP